MLYAQVLIFFQNLLTLGSFARAWPTKDKDDLRAYRQTLGSLQLGLHFGCMRLCGRGCELGHVLLDSCNNPNEHFVRCAARRHQCTLPLGLHEGVTVFLSCTVNAASVGRGALVIHRPSMHLLTEISDTGSLWPLVTTERGGTIGSASNSKSESCFSLCSCHSLQLDYG
jgi:hypothetical protein